MNAAIQFEHWRNVRDPKQSWGLAWFLASEFCKRFYASHGIVPWVINHDGMGYYGIAINKLPCTVNGQEDETLGRFTMGGDVENWRSGGTGGHGCALMNQCSDGVPTEQLVAAAIRHFEIPVLPAKSHFSCRHKRWGGSYEICFEVAAFLALRYEPDELAIWNHPDHIRELLVTHDPKCQMKEHPGGFLFAANDNIVCVAGDGRVLDGSEQSLWVEYMSGKSLLELSDMILRRLDNQKENE